MDSIELKEFARRYAQAWCSQDPESVAACYAREGSLKVNGDPPAVGRTAIADVARGFMRAFPDMEVKLDDLVIQSDGVAFHWTLTGTNTGPDGTGQSVRISGCEVWQMNGHGLIAESKGSFDADEYERQLEHGAARAD